MRSPEHFHTESSRWQRGTLAGKLRDEDFEEMHENMHWMQYISTGIGSLVSQVRYTRDRLILKEIWKRGLVAEAGKLLTGERSDPLLEFHDFSSEQFSVSMAVDAAKAASSLYWLETMLLGTNEDLHSRYPDFLNALCIFDNSQIGVDTVADFEAVTKRLTQSKIIGASTVENGQISTIDLMEAHSVIAEVSYYGAGNAGHMAHQRLEEVYHTKYADAIVFGLTRLDWQEGISEEPFQNYLFAIAVCLEIALDIDWVPKKRLQNCSLNSINPISRFILALDTAKDIPLVQIELDLSGKHVDSYREDIKLRSGLKCSYDNKDLSDTPFIDRILDHLLNEKSKEPPKIDENFPLPLPLYEVHAYISRRFHREKRDHRSGFLSDPLVCFLDTKEPYRGIHEPVNPDIVGLTKPPVICYEDGRFGMSDHSRIFARQYLQSSIYSYPTFSIAFEGGEIPFGPRKLKPVIDFAAIYYDELSGGGRQTGMFT